MDERRSTWPCARLLIPVLLGGLMAANTGLAQNGSVIQTHFRRPWLPFRAPAPPPPQQAPPQGPAPIQEPAPLDQQPRIDQPPASGAFFDLAPSGTASALSFAPNMFGDQFGGKSITAIIPQPPLFIPGPTQLFSIGPSTPVQAKVVGNFVEFFPGPTLVSLGPVLPVPPPFPQTIPLANNPFHQQLALLNATMSFGAGSTATLVNGVAEQVRNGQSETPGFNSVYTTLFTYLLAGPDLLIPQPPLILNIANPSGGGVVGRVRVAEDSSPLPRDRLIFNYDYFHDVPLGLYGHDVNRVVLGFEKTFLDGLCSFEVRFPFAATMNSTQHFGLENGSTEFGNLHLMLKGLLYMDQRFAFTGGIGIGLPTADDTVVQNFLGQDVIRIDNQSVILEPYLAVLCTPNDRLFSQFWVSLPFDPCGNDVSIDRGRGLQNAGTIHYQANLVLDGQIGFWLVRNDDRPLRTMAPFLELHYQGALEDPDLVNPAPGLVIGDLNGRFNELNLTVGLIFQFGDNVNFSVGGVLPLNAEDRSFDYQIGVRANVFFGRTARERQARNYVPGF